jgi:protein tyrosine/serine phosphatase
MTVERHLDWDGCYNVRDLGGLPTADGRTIRRGAIVRSDAASRLTAAGWAAAQAHGIRTVVDLRDPSEYEHEAPPRPADLTTIQLPLEDLSDAEFWQRWRPLCCTPLYYRPFLERFPRQITPVIAAIADAEPGGVLVHCGAGRDRTGLVMLVLLALVNVPPADIAADHALSADRLRIRSERLGRTDEDIVAQEQLRRASTSAEEAIAATLACFNAEQYLLAAGLGDDQIGAIWARMLGAPDAPCGVLP